MPRRATTWWASSWRIWRAILPRRTRRSPCYRSDNIAVEAWAMRFRLQPWYDGLRAEEGLGHLPAGSQPDVPSEEER